MSIEVNATEQIIEVNATGSTIDINVTSQTVDVNATTSVIDVNVTNGPGPGVPDGGLTGQVLKKQSNTDYDTYWAADTAGVPYTGATGNVDLGEYELKAGQLTLDTSPTGTASVGTTRWNDTIGSSETTLKGGNVILKNGVDLVARVVNKVTPNTTLTKAAYQAVRISGAQGQRLAVAFAQANNDNNSADTIGLVTETIATNQEGFIMTVGNLEDINTTGSLQGETWADGDVLYLSPTVAGAITNIKPVAPQHLVVIGYVEYAHANHGKIYVKVMNGWELGELHDVDTTGATNGQVLKYNGTIWTPSSDLDTGITSLNGLTALTQTFATGTSGTDFNISSATSTHTFNLPTASATNRGLVSSSDWSTFNAKIGGTLATGQVAFGSAANTISGSNSLFWDATNNRLGIGTNAPSEILNIRGATDATVSTILFNQQSNNSFTGYLKYTGSNNRIVLGGLFSNVNYEPLSISMNDRLVTFSNNITVSGNNIALGSGNITWVAATGLDFSPFGATSAMRIRQTTGNVLIGGTTDSGQRLQVNGDAFIKGSGNSSSTTALTVQNSDGNFIFNILNNRTGYFYSSGTTVGLVVGPISGATTGVQIQETRIRFNEVGVLGYSTSSGVGANNGGIIIQSVNTLNPTTANPIDVSYNSTFAPTSGTATYTSQRISPTINQTGGANGITRGLYVNPTLTAAADWRSIEWSNNTGWGLYGAGTSNNFLNGSLGIGTNTLTGYQLRIFKNLTGSTTSRIVGLNSQINSDVTDAYAIQSNPSIQDAVFTTYLKHFSAENAFKGASATLQEQIGFYASALSNGTSNYGFFGAVTSGTNRWNLYCNGTANNYMAGSLGVGSTSLTARNLYVDKNLTGGTIAYGITSQGAIQSDVTNSARYFQTTSVISGTAAVPNLYHYAASQGTFVGTATNQFGFFVENTLTGATNNFGFRADIASGTNRWNFYAGGTAANYLNGNTIIGGSATDGGQKLQVTGETVINGTGNTGGTRALTINNNAGEIFRFRNDGVLRFVNNQQSFAIVPQLVAGSPGTISVTGDVSMAITNFRAAGGQVANGVLLITKDFADTHTNGLTRYLYITQIGGLSFAPTSGTGQLTMAEIAPIINQTGGANGITRGLYVNPTLTAAADWRAIETSNNSGWAAYFAGSADLFVGDGADIQFGATNGTKLGTATSQKIGFWNATPIVQPTTAVTGATRVGGGGTNVTDTDTFDGYTIAQVVKALRNAGLLA